jgi:DNA invertase Pin-like site-specific DNA recombinase
MPKRVAIYTRVSTDGQTTSNQDLALELPTQLHGWKVTKTYKDHAVSGSIHPRKRPAMQQLLHAIKCGKVDMVAVYELSRLGRKTLDVLELANEFKRYSVDLYIHTMNIDTSSPYGEMIFTLMAGLAQMERAQLVERTKSGMERARLQGTKSGKAIGRPTITDPDLQAKVIQLRQQGKGYNSIASQLGIGSSTVRRLAAQ